MHFHFSKSLFIALTGISLLVSSLHLHANEREQALETISVHLAAISARDIDSLASTLSPKGNMLFILPASEIKYTTDAFLDYHREWFKQSGWSVKTTIVDVVIDHDIADFVVELMYREQSRNGKPYFNKLMVSYRLEKVDSNWYVVKDHATSIDKTPS